MPGCSDPPIAPLALLFPTDPLRGTRPDEHFARRAGRARELGIAVALVDVDAPAPAVRDLPAGARCVYQGWMLAAEHYDRLCAVVEEAGAHMVTGPAQYRRAHHLPGWYGALRAWTPASAWLAVDADPGTLVAAAEGLGSGAFVVKDWVKSRKHEWDTACFAPDAAAVPRVAAEMVRLGEAQVTGGIVIRAFEELRGAEARAWWVGGRPALVTAHPDTPDRLPDPDLASVLPDVAADIAGLGVAFVTTDLARRADGAWRVIELGDGQVSDFPPGGDYDALLRALAAGPVPASAPRRPSAT